MTFFKQTASLTLTGIRGIGQRLGASLVTVIGITTVVAVLLSLLSMNEGVVALSSGYAKPDRAVVLSSGANNVAQSSLPREAVINIGNAPGVRRAPDGTPYSTAAVMMQVDVVKKTGERGSVFMVGATPGSFLVNQELEIVDGRRYQPAVRELNVSESVRNLYKGMNVGDHINLRGTEWTIVGVYKDTNSGNDSMVRTDADTLMSAFARNTFQSVVVQLESPSAYGAFKDALTSDPAIQVNVQTDAAFQEQAMGQLRGLLTFVSYFVGGVMASGAIFGALNALYASVDSRRREIATLRAIGFNNGPIVVSVLAEAMVLALPAAFIGAFIAWALFNGNVVDTQGLVFRLTVTPGLVGVAVFWALAIGLIGGSLPALRAARLPVATALRRT